MKRTAPAAMIRLAFVLALFGLLGALHLSFAGAEASQPGQATQAIQAGLEPGYGIESCGDEGCADDYCAAPVESDMSGYAVPCETRRG